MNKMVEKKESGKSLKGDSFLKQGNGCREKKKRLVYLHKCSVEKIFKRLSITTLISQGAFNESSKIIAAPFLSSMFSTHSPYMQKQQGGKKGVDRRQDFHFPVFREICTIIIEINVVFQLPA